MENKKNYLKDLFFNAHFIVALLFTSIVMTGIVANYDFDLLGVIIRYKHVLSLVGITLVLFAIVFIPYLFVNLKNKKITIADSFYLSFIFIGLAFFIYIATTSQSFNLYKVSFAILALAVGGILLVLRMHFYYIDAKEPKFIAKNKVSKYYSAIFNKFHYISLLVISGIAVFLSYFLTEPATISIIKQPKTMIVLLICILPTIVYAFTKINSKTITVFDCFGVSCILAFPLILFKFIVFTYSPLKVIVWAVALLIYIVYLLLRFKFFDANATVKENNDHHYLSTLYSKYDIGLILSVGGLLAMFASLLIDGDMLHPLYAQGTIKFSVSLLPIVVLTATSLLTLAFFALVALFGVNKKDVCIADLFLQFCLSFILFGFISLISHPSIILLIMLVAFLVYSVILLTIRVHKCHKD
ncbi:MAG: hypothetical protein J6V71_02385 [Clostridia bacterium]|nr:hypothetical protein [Clostridia bacterium]